MSLTVSNIRIPSLTVSEPEKASGNADIDSQDQNAVSTAPGGAFSEAQTANLFAQLQKSALLAKTDATNADNSSAASNSTAFAQFNGGNSTAFAQFNGGNSTAFAEFNPGTVTGSIPSNGQYADIEAREINGVTVIRSKFRWMMLEAQGKADQLFFGENLPSLLYARYVQKYGLEVVKSLWNL